MIQVKTKNFRGGDDLVTTQYNWVGQPLRIVHIHQMPAVSGTTGQSTVTLTDIVYDDLGRILQTKMKVQNSLVNDNALPRIWTVINNNEYDALGQLKTKAMGIKRDAAGKYTEATLSSQDYKYNIRGWLLSINKDYTNASTNSDRYFALELGYDKDPSIGSNDNKQYNGNIGSMLWKSEGDQHRRKYDFIYDNANRLNAANFGQYTSGSGASAVFSNGVVDFSEYGISYDYNGNIKTLNRKGLKLNSSPVIDQLTYSYYTFENAPYKVTDGITGSDNGKLGDFKDGSVAGGDYNNNNGNGSLTTDFNKGINSIAYYRTIELPKTITTDKGTVGYVYSTGGEKLTKQTIETAATVAYGDNTYTNISITTTTYLGGAVYESKAYTNNSTLNTALGYTDRLQLIAHEEGRIRPQYNNASTPNTPTGFVYDYFIKDHLGNIRMVLTDEHKQDIYPAATLEGDINTDGSPNAAYIEKNYYTIDPAKIALTTDATGITDYENNNGSLIPNNNPNSVTGNTSEKLYKLKATSTAGETGLGITLKVMAGDRIDIFGKSYYFTNVVNGGTNNKDITTLSILAGLLGGPTGGNAAAAHGGVTAGQLNGFSTTTDGIGSLFADQLTEIPNSSSKPRAFINYIFFDEQLKSVGYGFDAVGDNGTVKPHQVQNKTAPKNGYVYIYVSNQSQVDVFFDNLQVIHTRGAILEETHYYPFGMTMAGISSKALNGIAENKYKYNGIEQNTDFDLNMYDAFYRNFDPQTGRWWQIDPKPNDSESPYVAMGNNPILYSDFLGDTSILSKGVDIFFKGVDWFNRNLNPLVDVYHLATGKDFITGEDVSRTSAATGVVLAMIPGGKVEGAVVKNLEKATLKEGAEAVEKKSMKEVEKKLLPDDAKVVRGGKNTPEAIEAGTGIHPEGVKGVSVECGSCSVEELSKAIPHGQVGVTTVGEVRKAGGDVIKTSGKSPNHATLTGISPEKTSELLTPTIKNPSKK